MEAGRARRGTRGRCARVSRVSRGADLQEGIRRGRRAAGPDPETRVLQYPSDRRARKGAMATRQLVPTRANWRGGGNLRQRARTFPAYHDWGDRYPRRYSSAGRGADGTFRFMRDPASGCARSRAIARTWRVAELRLDLCVDRIGADEFGGSIFLPGGSRTTGPNPSSRHKARSGRLRPAGLERRRSSRATGWPSPRSTCRAGRRELHRGSACSIATRWFAATRGRQRVDVTWCAPVAACRRTARI